MQLVYLRMLWCYVVDGGLTSYTDQRICFRVYHLKKIYLFVTGKINLLQSYFGGVKWLFAHQVIFFFARNSKN